MQQSLGCLHVYDVLEANVMVREVIPLKPAILSSKSSYIKHITILSSSDASHAGLTKVYGQCRVLIGLKIDPRKGVMYHPTTWTSHKQEKISYSSYCAETLATSDADDRGYHLKQALRASFPDNELKHEHLVKSELLFKAVTTLHQSSDHQLGRVVAPDSQ